MLFFNIYQKFQSIVFKLKDSIKKEKAKRDKTYQELNTFVKNRGDLEKIFSESVDEAKKDILARKLKDSFMYSKFIYY